MGSRGLFLNGPGVRGRVRVCVCPVHSVGAPVAAHAHGPVWSPVVPWAEGLVTAGMRALGD